jgi:hypothetical protein
MNPLHRAPEGEQEMQPSIEPGPLAFCGTKRLRYAGEEVFMVFPIRSGHRPDAELTIRSGHIARDILPMTVVISVLTFCLACSSLSLAPSGGSTSSYFLNPDRVWAAILETLVDLEYEVAESNRPDGTIRTAPQSNDDGPEIVLSIDQVMHTQDQVNVYIKPSAGQADDTVDPGVLKAAADRFKASLDKKLLG